MIKRYRPMDETELEGFRAIIKECGADGDGFKILVSEGESRQRPGEISPIIGTVTIEHSKSGVSRLYQAGHGTSWMADFARDLRAGRFRTEWS